MLNVMRGCVGRHERVCVRRDERVCQRLRFYDRSCNMEGTYEVHRLAWCPWQSPCTEHVVFYETPPTSHRPVFCSLPPRRDCTRLVPRIEERCPRRLGTR